MLTAMEDSSSTVPKFYVAEHIGPLSYLEEEEETLDQSSTVMPNASIPASRTSNLVGSSGANQSGDDSVFRASATVPQLRHRPLVQPRPRFRVQSAPTLLEHEIGLVLRGISDDFDNSYGQSRMNQARRASHPNTNNHRSPGLLDNLRQLNPRSWVDSSTSSENAVPGGSDRRGSIGPSQHASVLPVPEEEEEAVERESN